MSLNNFVEVKKGDFDKYAEKCDQAGHCMLFARLPNRYFEGCALRAAVLMQMRFDGHIGFPGGIIEPKEEVLHGLVRELEEEMNFDSKNIKLTEDNHVVTHYHKSTNMLLHFYVLEVSEKVVRDIEHRALTSRDYGEEVMGIFRVPLHTMEDGKRGFPMFLGNSFVGNTYEQLKRGLIHASILTEEEVKAAEASKIAS